MTWISNVISSSPLKVARGQVSLSWRIFLFGWVWTLPLSISSLLRAIALTQPSGMLTNRVSRMATQTSLNNWLLKSIRHSSATIPSTRDFQKKWGRRNDAYIRADQRGIQYYAQTCGGRDEAFPKEKATEGNDFCKVFDKFVHDCGGQNDRVHSTYEKFAAVKNLLSNFREELSFEFFDRKGLNDYVAYLSWGQKGVSSANNCHFSTGPSVGASSRVFIRIMPTISISLNLGVVHRRKLFSWHGVN